MSADAPAPRVARASDEMILTQFSWTTQLPAREELTHWPLGDFDDILDE